MFITYWISSVKGGELYDHIVDKGEYSEDETKAIIIQIVNAVDYLHQNGIAHRDLKVGSSFSSHSADWFHHMRFELSISLLVFDNLALWVCFLTFVSLKIFFVPTKLE